MRRIAALVKTGDEGPMYEGWAASQEMLRKLLLVGDPLYNEPANRTAAVADDENADVLKAVLELFNGLDEHDAKDGLKAIMEQQNSGNDVADVTKNEPGKYANRFQEQFSGVGFASLIDRLISSEVNRRSAAAMALVQKALAALAQDRKDREDERKGEEERKRREEKDREDERKGEEDKKALCAECGKSLSDGHTHEKKEAEEKHEDEEKKAMSARIAALEQQLAQAQASASAFQNPLGSRSGQTLPIPGGAGAPGVLNPTTTMQGQESLQKANAFGQEGMKLLNKYMTTDPAHAESLREDLREASMAFKFGGQPMIKDPELQEVASRLGLPFGFAGQPGFNEGGAQ